MADLTFNLTTGKLCITSSGQCWNAVSGPHGKGQLPAGKYRVRRNYITDYTSQIEKPYQDKTGKGFFLPIEPLFASSRSGFGIHPDGNVPGTNGCIGLTSANTHPFFAAIASMGLGEYSLEVF